ncbi:MAG: FAD-binding oxidoreductase, partial [Actinomycetia bacterium]|nr:FAD-binding oxidoreductase [Actinomycetes bacterium]
LVGDRGRFAGVASLDLTGMTGLIALDPVSLTATFGAGTRGPDAERELAARGLTIGHYPQSFEFASLGGYAATRSSGQSSCGNGRFDALVVGLRVATPVGELRAGLAPASAAGPDLRELFLGGEGALGVITEVTVQVRARLAEPSYEGWTFPSFADGATAMRALVQAGLRPSVLRLSDETETFVNLATLPAGDGDPVTGALMIVGYETPVALAAREPVTAALRESGGTLLAGSHGAAWVAGRFAAPYLRDSLLDVGVLTETLETATFWSNWPRLYQSVAAALRRELGEEDAVVMCHISHVYETGCSLYYTVAVREQGDPIAQWRRAKAAASDAIAASGGTITHHHGVGRDHLPWYAREIGPVGVTILRAVKQAVDPDGILNPGVLIPAEPPAAARPEPEGWGTT